MHGDPIHFLGVCGRAMGGIAVALARAGHRVTGSDQATYGSTRERLRAAGIHVFSPYAASNVPEAPCLVVVGKRVDRDNPELDAVLRRGLPTQSFPAFLRSRFLDRSRNAVIAGGVGKTTTTAMLTWILEDAGLRPDYLIGGVAGNFEDPARFDGRGVTVLEGDEYASCFDDATPKFLHYAPEVVAVTNLLEDHPDLYPDAAALDEAFGRLVRLLPGHGSLIVPSEDRAAAALARHAGCRVMTVGTDPDSDRPITYQRAESSRSTFAIGDVAFDLPMCGPMNVRNAAMAAAAAEHFGVSLARSARALALFKGVDDRQQGRQVGSCTLVTDKASHPESLRELAAALRQRYPDRRLLIVLEPRATGGRHWIYQRDLPAALAVYDAVLLLSAYEHAPPRRTAWQSAPFSVDALASALEERSVAVTTVPVMEELGRAVATAAQPGSVILMALREQHGGHVAMVEQALLDRERAAAAG